MFCPKCGIQNPETGKYCRSCGTDLSPVSAALAGKSNNKMASGFGMSIQPLEPMNPWTGKDKSVSWQSMMSTMFVGFAFLVISIILGVTGAANASRWWFWMLIPAFAMIGTGVAQYVQLKKNEQKILSTSEQETVKYLNQNVNASLPPPQTNYAAAPESRYKTGDLVPPSITDNTTRHLEMNSEGETMTLPKK